MPGSLALLASPPRCGSQLLHHREDESLNYSQIIGILLLGNSQLNVSYFIIKMLLIQHP